MMLVLMAKGRLRLVVLMLRLVIIVIWMLWCVFLLLMVGLRLVTLVTLVRRVYRLLLDARRILLRLIMVRMRSWRNLRRLPWFILSMLMRLRPMNIMMKRVGGVLWCLCGLIWSGLLVQALSRFVLVMRLMR